MRALWSYRVSFVIILFGFGALTGLLHEGALAGFVRAQYRDF